MRSNRGSTSRRRFLALLNAALVTYLAALALDFWPILRSELSAFHLVLPSALRQFFNAVGGGVWEPRSLLLPAAFLIGLVLTPFLRLELSRLEARGALTRSRAIGRGLIYVVAVVYALNALVAAWRFFVQGSGVSVGMRVVLTIGSTLFAGTQSLLVFAPVVVIAVASVTWVNVAGTPVTRRTAWKTDG